MQIAKKAMGITLSLLLAIIFIFNNSFIYANESRINPTREQLEEKIEEIAEKRGIPSVILKSIARVESVYQQYKPDGTVYLGPRGSIGLMQIYNRSGAYDTRKLMYDIDYNIKISADILLEKWQNYGQIGNMDPNVLENWYFAIWAYNGWASVNNPNTGKKKYTYQQLVYMMAEQEYGQEISFIDTSLLPKEGRPDKNISVPTPENIHYGDIETYKRGDVVQVEVNEALSIRNNPSGNIIVKVPNGTILEVIEGPVLNDRLYWYKVKDRNTNIEGWVAGNWVAKVGTIFAFEDIGDSWAKEYITKLKELGIVSGDSKGNFYPNKKLSREELSVIITKALSLDSENYKLTYRDNDEISEWAVEYVKAVSKAKIMVGNEGLQTFYPKRDITRQEVAIIIERIYKYLEEKNEQAKEINDENADIEEKESELELQKDSKDEEKTNEGNQQVKNEADNLEKNDVKDNDEKQKEKSEINMKDFKDLEDVSFWAYDSVKFVVKKGIFEGKDGMLRPEEYLTKAQVSKIIIKLLEDIGQIK